MLNKSELNSLDHNYKVSLERLQRLYPATPSAVVYFLAGSLPAVAILHKKQFSLLGMFARLGPSNILHKHGTSVLTSPSTDKFSWFTQLKLLSVQYCLPDPITILTNPPTKSFLKRMVKLKVLDWWQYKFRAEAALLPSLSLLRCEFMSLQRTHPIWPSAGCKPYEVKKATVQAGIELAG